MVPSEGRAGAATNSSAECPRDAIYAAAMDSASLIRCIRAGCLIFEAALTSRTMSAPSISLNRSRLASDSFLPFASLLYSGQRGGDVVKMMRPDAKVRTIKLVQEKTATPLTIPIHPEWRKAINAGPSKGVSLIGDSNGRPITRPMLTIIIAQAAAKAGLPKECKAHGLRKALLRRLAEAGKSAKQIAAMSGHKTLKEIERYTEAADQARLAEQAMDI